VNFSFKNKYQLINPLGYLEIFARPDWYLELGDELKELFFNDIAKAATASDEWRTKRRDLVNMVTELLEAEHMALGDMGQSWDKARQPIDTVVIHHSGTAPDITIGSADARGLLRLYVPVYSKQDEPQYGQAIWSGHIYNGRQTFIPYHYLIWQDGTTKQVLKDKYIGWHAGNRNYNQRSIAICLVDDLEEQRPTKQALGAAREIIKSYQPKEILGHREVRDGRTCPGALFLGDAGWKNELL